MAATSVLVLLGLLMAVTSSLALSCVDIKDKAAWTPCPGMTPVKDIDLDQVSGRWFLHERLIPYSGPDPETPTVTPLCLAMTPIRTARGILAIGDFLGPNPEQSNLTYVIQDPVSNPGLWDETETNPDGTETTVALSQLTHQETDYMVFTLCPANTVYACNQLGEEPSILVWGRNATANSLDLGPINDKITQAGIDYIKKAVKIDTSACDGYVRNS